MEAQPPPPPPVSKNQQCFAAGTRGWFLRTIFQPKSAAEPGVGSVHGHEQPCTAQKKKRSSWVLHQTLIAFVLNLHCLKLSTRTQHSGWNKSAIRSSVEDNLTGSVHGNVYGA